MEQRPKQLKSLQAFQSGFLKDSPKEGCLASLRSNWKGWDREGKPGRKRAKGKNDGKWGQTGSGGGTDLQGLIALEKTRALTLGKMGSHWRLAPRETWSQFSKDFSALMILCLRGDLTLLSYTFFICETSVTFPSWQCSILSHSLYL